MNRTNGGRIDRLVLLLVLLGTGALAGCSANERPAATVATADPFADAYEAAAKRVASFHDSFDFPTTASSDAALRVRLAADSRLDSLGNMLARLPTPHTKEQRYFYARSQAYLSAAAHWLEAQYEAAMGGRVPTHTAGDGVREAEMRSEEQLGATVALNEQYDLLASAEKKFLQTSVLWDRLRVLRGPDQSVPLEELKRRMAQADSLVASDYAAFN